MKFIHYCNCCCAVRRYLSTSSSLLSLKCRPKVIGSRIKQMEDSFKNNNQHRKSSTLAINYQYEEAVKALNGLQSNACVLEQVRKQRRKKSNIPNTNLSATQKYLERVGVSMNELDKLPIIHLAGTKGKGSTCAFVECILREHGLKTGFYSSPHLVAVRERIRINGLPISKTDFSYYFWEVYDKLSSKRDEPRDMPAYFKFLTVLAFQIFLREEVDVAVIEVGIGGEFDCTNVVRCPVVCGITSLGIDHTSHLGDTIEEIAWHKAGIMKRDVPTFTVGQQPPEALKVLSARAKEKGSKLSVVPPLENYQWGGRHIHLGLSGYVQFLNASLALQLARYFLRNAHVRSNAVEASSSENNNKGCDSFALSEEDVVGLENVLWPGRSQTVVKGKTTFFIDGAHTVSSIQNCVDWYEKVALLHAQSQSAPSGTYRVLVFNITGDRDHETILAKLYPCAFHLAIFTTNLVTKEMKASSDQTNFTVSDAHQMRRIRELKNYWTKLSIQNPPSSSSPESKARTEESRTEDARTCLTFPCTKDALLWLSCFDGSYVSGEITQEPAFPPPSGLRDASHVQVLVTGSLHLVGAVLAVLDPALSGASEGRGDLVTSSIADLVKRKYAHSQMSIPGAP